MAAVQTGANLRDWDAGLRFEPMNLIRQIVSSRLPRGFKIALLSLLAWIVLAAPLLLVVAFGPRDSNPVLLSWLAFGGTVLGQCGIIVGLLLALRDALWGRR